MRNFLILIAVFVFVSLSFGYSVIYEGDATDMATGNIQFELDALSPGDTLFLKMTEVAWGAREVCLMIDDGKALIVHPESELIYIDRDILSGYPINTITILDSGYVEGFAIGNTSGTGCAIWGDNKYAIKNCSFLDCDAHAFGVGIDGQEILIEGCSFNAVNKIAKIDSVEKVNLVDCSANGIVGGIELSFIKKAHIQGLVFRADSGAPIVIQCQQCDSVDIAQSQFRGVADGIEAIRFLGQNTINLRNLTITHYHNGVGITNGDLVTGRVTSCIFDSVQCSIASFSDVFRPTFMGFNHFGEIYGDSLWGVEPDTFVSITFGDPNFEDRNEKTIGHSSFCYHSGDDGTHRGYEGGLISDWWGIPVIMSIPDSSADSSLIEFPEITAGPNPFNSTLGITFDLGAVELNIFDLSGRVVELVRVEGLRSYAWNVPIGFSSGNYLIRVIYPDGVIVKKTVTLVR